MARNISLLNNQLVVSSGSITNPSNSVSVIKNSERVRNDILNIAEYINGYIYYLTKNLTNGNEFLFDAAEKGLCGDTIVTDLDATSNSGNTFWYSVGENVGRAKTIKESIEALEAKLIQQQVNISVLERVNVSNLSSNLNSNIQLTSKIKTNMLGNQFTKDSSDLTYPLSEYVYRLYNTLFSQVDFYNELNVGGNSFPILNFNYKIGQTLVDGCGSYLSLQDELSALKTMINGETCDPAFNISFDQSVYDSEPSNIKQYLQELHDIGVTLTNSTTINATDIAEIETQLANIQGASLATEEIAGMSEQATTSEILMGTGVNGDKKLFMSPDNFCSVIINSNQATFMNSQVSQLGLAWETATNYVLNHSNLIKTRNSYNYYVSLGANGQDIFLEFGRCYFISANVLTSNCKINNINDLSTVDGEILTIKKSSAANSLVITNDEGFLFDGLNSYTLNTAYECVTFMINKTAGRIEVISKYVQ